ncbi:hypothetical protein AC578_7791 [Pseudocercospora eumusae]|uniref:Uncharacterized protein n=1 Tax=Pseudocercospora eumusae TaxID=321146 RepID=A0A139GW74_9PEZI|nr:hypothetical protein AC578_7791 [Pseudocercospora eumusae]
MHIALLMVICIFFLAALTAYHTTATYNSIMDKHTQQRLGDNTDSMPATQAPASQEDDSNVDLHTSEAPLPDAFRQDASMAYRYASPTGPRHPLLQRSRPSETSPPRPPSPPPSPRPRAREIASLPPSGPNLVQEGDDLGHYDLAHDIYCNVRDFIGQLSKASLDAVAAELQPQLDRLAHLIEAGNPDAEDPTRPGRLVIDGSRVSRRTKTSGFGESPDRKSLPKPLEATSDAFQPRSTALNDREEVDPWQLDGSNAAKLKTTPSRKRRASITRSVEDTADGSPKPPEYYLAKVRNPPGPGAEASPGSRKSPRKSSEGVQLSTKDDGKWKAVGSPKSASGDRMDVDNTSPKAKASIPPVSRLERPGTPVPGQKPSPEERYTSDSITISSTIPNGGSSTPITFYSHRETPTAQKDFVNKQFEMQRNDENSRQPTW